VSFDVFSFVCFESFQVQVIAWTDSPLKWPIVQDVILLTCML